MHVCRSLSVWNVCGTWGYMSTLVHGEDVCAHMCDAHMCVCVFNMFVRGEHADVYSPALADPGPYGWWHSLIFLLILLTPPPTSWARWIPAGECVQVSQAPCCP